LRSPGRFLATAKRLLELSREADQVVRRRAATAWMHAEAYQLHTLATVTRLAAGAKPGAEASLTKVWWSELDIELHEVALDVLGPEAELEASWSKGWQFALSGPIYAGTNEIQRNIAAERILGLPR
jgi:alkylation response protein AidB-like acyl-CoA dehydrogenase